MRTARDLDDTVSIGKAHETVLEAAGREVVVTNHYRKGVDEPLRVAPLGLDRGGEGDRPCMVTKEMAR